MEIVIYFDDKTCKHHAYINNGKQKYNIHNANKKILLKMLNLEITKYFEDELSGQ